MLSIWAYSFFYIPHYVVFGSRIISVQKYPPFSWLNRVRIGIDGRGRKKSLLIHVELWMQCKCACEWEKTPPSILYSCMNNDMLKVHAQIPTNTCTHADTICSIIYNLWILIKTQTTLHLHPFIILLFKSTTGNMRLLSYANKKPSIAKLTTTTAAVATVAAVPRRKCIEKHSTDFFP